MNRLDKDTLYKMHVVERMSISDISRHFSVGKSAVTNWLTKAEIPITRKVEKLNLSENILRDLYLNKKLAARAIAIKFNTSTNVVTSYLRKYQIPIRTGAERNNPKDGSLEHRNKYAFERLSSREWLREHYIRQMKSIQWIASETIGNPVSVSTVYQYLDKTNLAKVRDRYRNFVLFILCKKYIQDPKFRYKDASKLVKWVRPEHIKAKLTELGIDPKQPNDYPRMKYNKSQVELDVISFIKQFRTNVITNKFLPDNGSNKRRSIDIFLPDDQLCIEVNGIFYHSVHNGFERMDHIRKKQNALDAGYDLIYIWEDDIKLKPEIVQSMLMNKLKITPNRIYARKTKIIELKSTDKNNFLNDNHLQGRCNSSFAYGLVYGNQLVCCISFLYDVRKKMYELNRFCNKLETNVVGGFSKLLKHFESLFNNPPIISYSHNDWSNGEVYKNNGFTFSHVNPPSYTYYNNRIQPQMRVHRTSYQKKNIIKKYNLPVHFINKFTEDELVNMVNEMTNSPSLLKIYDCGTTTWIKNHVDL